MINNWLLYGANGFTGELITEEAIRNGEKPVLAGRSSKKIFPIADKFNLDYEVFDLLDEKTILDNIYDYDLIFNAAGPYKYTAGPMVKACIKAGKNYVDITGEVSVFEENFKLDQQARESEIVIISGVGFDVVPSDCMAKYVSEKINNPISLDIGVAGLSSASQGTLKTMVEHMNVKSMIRLNGDLIEEAPEKPIRKIRFYDEIRKVNPVVWGDLSTAYRSTRIQNITTYMPFPKTIMDLLNATLFTNEKPSKQEFVKKAYEWIENNIKGPDSETQMNAKSYIWAQVKNEKGEEAQSWLETIEPYRFTAISGIKCVKKISESLPIGVLTPSLAFGEDFILEFPDTHRYDTLEG